MDEADWRAEMLRVTRNASNAELETSPSTIQDLEQDFIEVNYPDTVNTLRTLANASDAVHSQTRVVPRPQRETVQFKYCHRKLAEEIHGKPLMRKILEEDIPNRRKFKPEYSIYDGFVVVSSPEFADVRLFPGEITLFWNLTGVYEEDGVFKHRFEQELPFRDKQSRIEDSLDKYRQKRVFQLIRELRVPCQDCADGNIEFAPSNERERMWSWRCLDCGAEHGHTDSIQDVASEVDPLWSRARIRETFKDIGRDATTA